VGLEGTTASAVGAAATSAADGTTIYGGEFSTRGLASSIDGFYVGVFYDSLVAAGTGSTLFPLEAVDAGASVCGAALF
jgi:hypothetical protein